MSRVGEKRMNVMTYPKSVLFDTYALIAYFQDEPSANKIARYLNRIETGRMVGYVSCVSVTEILSRIGTIDARKASMILAYLEGSLMQMLPLGYIEARHAGNLRIKYRNLKLSTADVLIIASAMLRNIEIVVTGDDAWKKVEEISVLEI
jgi:predicted nucleic acid-binding protein